MKRRIVTAAIIVLSSCVLPAGAAVVAEQLERLGLEVHTGVAHTAVPFKSHATSTYRGETVGVMHACGHDSHTAMLMGIARILAGVRDMLPGNVLFIFQPAEEGAPADGSRPWQSVDPIVTSAQIISALQTVVSRDIDITENPAAANGATAELTLGPGSDPVLFNDPALTRQILPTLQRVVGAQLDYLESREKH